MGIKDIETIGLLVLGTAGFAFGVYQYVDKKRSQKTKINVTLQNGLLTGHFDELSEPMLILKASNIGSKDVIINTPNINVKHSDGGSLFTKFGSYQSFPYVLKSGDSVHAWVEIKTIAQALKKYGLSGTIKIEGYFVSQIGDEYKAKPYKLNVDGWTRN